jgi:hypothetical protein
MSTISGKTKFSTQPNKLHLPFALPIVEGKKLKKKCCKKYKKGKRCGRCPKV